MIRFTPEERLAIYKEALDDWSLWRAISSTTSELTDTSLGFCHYFDCNNHKGLTIGYDETYEVSALPELYNQNMKYTKGVKHEYHYPGRGSSFKGRYYRLRALKRAVKEVKQLI